LFPYSYIVYIENGSNDLVYLLQEKIIFDLVNFYKVTRDGLEINLHEMVKHAHRHNHGDHNITFSDEEDEDVFYEEPSYSSDYLI